MRVDPSASNVVQANESHGTKRAHKTHEAREGKGPHHHRTHEAREGESGANAEVSDRAREMASARAAANDAPETREDKIADIKARIAGGRYHVDSNAVADRLVDDHIRMSGIG